ncbi:MFS transporter [Heyndrickxia coagulans]|uniref:MFS transporter n=1 Tax=Heyndrickxia TaxID=2837504 RepID=UPI0021B4CCB9|nr:MFS transporter [Heyndrickxia coagulans]UXC22783.1 MFS transporter [Heyndrickxia coagulans]
MPSINARIERIPNGRFNKKLLKWTGLGYIYENMDGTLLSLILPVLTAVWSLSSQQTGVLASSLFVGYLFGTLCAGYLGDKFGRKNIIMWALAFYCIATIISAFSTNWTSFFWFRVLAGFGTGGETAIIAPYVAEMVSSKFRGRYTSLLTSFFPIGNLLAGALAYFIVPNFSEGWRIATIISALPIFMILFYRRYLPESPRWLESKGRIEEANRVMESIEKEVEKDINQKLPDPKEDYHQLQKIERKEKIPFVTLFSGQYAKRTIMLWIVWFTTIFANFGFISWMPSLLVKQGFTITHSFGYTIIIYAAQFPGYLIAAFLNDKLGRKITLSVAMILATISTSCMAHSVTALTIVTSGVFMSMFMSTGFGVLYTYTPEQYPTFIRAFGMGAASGFSRIGAITAPIIIGYVYPEYGFVGVFTMTTCILLVGIVAVLVLGTETKSKSLDEISSIDDISADTNHAKNTINS